MELIVLVFFVFAAVVNYRNRRQVEVGVLHDQNGTPYGYALGNFLQAEAATFHGVEIMLPGKMANFYLDSHGDGKIRGPSQLFEPQQRLQLEGDFDRYFQLFAPKQAVTDVLSIVSPDVMQTLIRSSARYDVELSDDHLRVIAPKKIYGDMTAKAEILEAAQAVLHEIVQRHVSWRPQGQIARLRYKKGKTLKVAGRYLRRSRLAMASASVLLAIEASGLSLLWYYTYHDPHFTSPYNHGLVQGTLMYASTIMLILSPIAVTIGLFAFVAAYGRRSDKLFRYLAPRN